MVKLILEILALSVMGLYVYFLFQVWQDQQTEKKRLTEKRKHKPFRKAEYDCTENFYEQDFK